MAGPGWWDAAFRSAYLEVYRHRDDSQAAAEVAGLLPRLRQAPGPVIDAGCGGGRHLAALRAAGLCAVGFDLSADLLQVAQARTACAGRLIRADLRAPPLASDCGAVLCLFTAFGYFDDAGNAACLAALSRLVASGGWVVLDLPEPAALRRNLVPTSERRTPGGWLVREHRRLVGPRVEKSVEAIPPDAPPHHWSESVRLHSVEELHSLAAQAGLAMHDCWPGLGGPDDHSQRLVVWLRRLSGTGDGSR